MFLSKSTPKEAESFPFMVLGNKSDLVDDRRVSNLRQEGKKKADPMAFTDEDYLRRIVLKGEETVKDAHCNAEGWTDFAPLLTNKYGIATLQSGFRFKQCIPGGKLRPSVDSPVLVKFTGRLLKKKGMPAGESKQQSGKIMVPQGGQKLTIEQPVEDAAHAMTILIEIAMHLGFRLEEFPQQVQEDFTNLFLSQREGSIWKIHIPEKLMLGESGSRVMYRATDLIFTMECIRVMENGIPEEPALTAVTDGVEEEDSKEKDEL